MENVLEIGDYTVTLEGELENNHFKGDITISLRNNKTKYEGIIFKDIVISHKEQKMLKKPL